MKDLSKKSATVIEVDENALGQRLDNFLLRHCKGVPKSHIYRIIRDGQVRINSKRVDANRRLELHDKVRMPPLRIAQTNKPILNSSKKVVFDILFEDDALLAINKPAGLAVHGGSGVSFGVIEQLRQQRPQAKFLELVHRLDRETSGILLLAKKRSALIGLHEAIREGNIEKWYLALVKGRWTNSKQHVKLALNKYVTSAGERRVNIEEDGMPAHTIFTLKQNYDGFSLLEAELKTGRTHQIRVHLAHLGFPICGDDKYGDFALNKELAKQGLKRMFLHAQKITFSHPKNDRLINIEASLPKELQEFLGRLK